MDLESFAVPLRKQYIQFQFFAKMFRLKFLQTRTLVSITYGGAICGLAFFLLVRFVVGALDDELAVPGSS